MQSLSSDSAARGIEAVELQWNGAIDTNGTTVTLTGTAEVSWNGLDVEIALGL